MSQSAVLERTPTAPDGPGPGAGAPARSTEGRTPARDTVRHPSRQYATSVTAGIGAVIVLLSVVLMAYAAPARSSAPTRPAAPTGRAPAPRGPVQLQRDLRPARDAGFLPALGGSARAPAK